MGRRPRRRRMGRRVVMSTTSTTLRKSCTSTTPPCGSTGSSTRVSPGSQTTYPPARWGCTWRVTPSHDSSPGTSLTSPSVPVWCSGVMLYQPYSLVHSQGWYSCGSSTSSSTGWRPWSRGRGRGSGTWAGSTSEGTCCET